MGSIDPLSTLARGLQDAATLAAFGAALFRAAIAAPELAQVALARLERVALAAALVFTAAWLLLETSSIAGAADPIGIAQALPVVVLDTHFGRLCVARLALLLGAALLRGAWPRTVVLGLAICAMPLMGHAGATPGPEGAMLVASESLHLLAAGAWLGGLPPLLVLTWRLPAAQAAAVARAFTPLGIACVLLLGGTGVVQGASLIGGMPELFGTAYGRVALVKLGGFLVLLGLALANRLAFATPTRTVTLRRSIAVEAVLGLGVVLAAGLLASLEPGMDQAPGRMAGDSGAMTQPAATPHSAAGSGGAGGMRD